VYDITARVVPTTAYPRSASPPPTANWGKPAGSNTTVAANATAAADMPNATMEAAAKK